MHELHKKILNRLMAAWVAISLVLGGGVVLYGFTTIDKQLVALASSESARLAQSKLPALRNVPADALGLEGVAADFARRQFVSVELFDRGGQPVVAEINPRHADLANAFARAHKRLPVEGELHYEKHRLNDATVLQVMIPLVDAAGDSVGHFQGVFLIDPATITRLRTNIALTLAVVLGAVLLTTLVLYPVILALNRDVMRYSQNLLHANIDLMEVMGSAIAKRDSDTNIHNYRVAVYAVRLAEAAGLDAQAIGNLIAGAFLHDVGKIGITDAILLKPGRLDAAEFAIMRSHVSLGVDILRKSVWLERARDVVEFHHEKFDGSGYLKGLKGEEIPINARIFAIVDVFDALTSKRPYKDPIPYAETMAIIHASRGTHFDPRLVDIFDAMIEPLYRQVSSAADPEVEAMLQAIIRRYYLPENGR